MSLDLDGAIGYLKFAMAPKCRDASIHTGIDSKE